MKKRLLKGLGIGFLLMLLCTPLFATRTPQAACLPDTLYQDNQALLRDAAQGMVRGVGQAAMQGTAGDYFLAAMIPYCEAGIALANDVARFSDDRDLARLAGEKSLGEELLLKRMQSLKRGSLTLATRLDRSSTRSFVRLMQEVGETTWQDIQPALSDPNPEHSFITVMVAYGEGAIDMAKVVLIFENDQEMRDIAQHVIGMHQADVKSMQSWLRNRQPGETCR